MIKKLTAKDLDEDPDGCLGKGSKRLTDEFYGKRSIFVIDSYRVARNFKFAGSNFCGFSSDPRKKFQQIKITANIFPAKIYCIVNILELRYTNIEH